MTDEPDSSPRTVTEECVDDIFEALGHPYRRQLLFALTEHAAPVPARDPYDIVSTDADPDVLTLQLHHTHLPKLDNLGFIDWDRPAETVTRGPRFTDIEPLLSLLSKREASLPYVWP